MGSLALGAAFCAGRGEREKRALLIWGNMLRPARQTVLRIALHYPIHPHGPTSQVCAKLAKSTITTARTASRTLDFLRRGIGPPSSLLPHCAALMYSPVNGFIPPIPYGEAHGEAAAAPTGTCPELAFYIRHVVSPASPVITLVGRGERIQPYLSALSHDNYSPTPPHTSRLAGR